MSEHRGQVDDAGRRVDSSRLYRRNLMLTERLAHDVEATRQRCIAEAALRLPCPSGPDRGDEGLLWVDQFGLGLGQGGCESRNRFTGPVHGRPPLVRTSKLTAPDLERLPRTPCPIASLTSSGISALSSLLARSWSRKASRVLRKSAANSAQEFDELISTIRIASMRGFGGSAMMRCGTSPDWTHRQNFFSADTRTVR